MSATAFIDSRDHPTAVPYYKLFKAEPIETKPAECGALLQIAEVIPLPDVSLLWLLRSIVNAKLKPPRQVLIVSHGSGGGLQMPMIRKIGTVGITETNAINANMAGKASDSEAAETLHLPMKDFLKLKAALEAVHKLQLDRVEIRACIVGENSEVLDGLRLLFGAKVMGAPRTFDVFVPINPGASAHGGGWQLWRDKHKTATVDGTAPDRFAWEWSFTLQKVDAIAESRTAAAKWVSSKFPNASNFHGGPIPAHGFSVLSDALYDTLVFPKDAAFCKHLNAVSGTAKAAHASGG